jgi:hypothetical protein
MFAPGLVERRATSSHLRTSGRPVADRAGPSNNAHRVRRRWFSPDRDGRLTSCSRSAGSGRRTPAAATRWIRCPTASPDTPYRAPISRSTAGGACPNPAQSNTDLARPLRGPRTRQMSCETTSGTVLPGNGAASRVTATPSPAAVSGARLLRMRRVCMTIAGPNERDQPLGFR